MSGLNSLNPGKNYTTLIKWHDAKKVLPANPHKEVLLCFADLQMRYGQVGEYAFDPKKGVKSYVAYPVGWVDLEDIYWSTNP